MRDDGRGQLRHRLLGSPQQRKGDMLECMEYVICVNVVCNVLIQQEQVLELLMSAL